MAFDELNLHSDLLRATEALGWKDPTPIQQQAIPASYGRARRVGRGSNGERKNRRRSRSPSFTIF
jgi:superfamily II DNA/RNA helicase